MASSMTLYHYWRSSCSWRVRWALAVKKLAYHSVPINLLANEQRQASYLQINPSGSVPCLSVQRRNLSESLAIMEWLEEQHPQPPLLPSDPWTRAQVREFCGIISSIQSVQNLKVLQYYSSQAQDRQQWARYFIEQGLQNIEKRLQMHAGSFCFGGQLSFADLFLIPQVYNAKRFTVNMQPYPLTESIYQRCLLLPECDQAAPHNQPGANQSP
ncbi:MAG: maleylacetoacetate isomerase [Oligoflexus sp.]